MMIVYIMTRVSLEGPARKAINKNKRLSLQRTAPYCPPTPRSRFLVDGGRVGHVVVGDHFVVGEDVADPLDQEETIANAEHHLSSPSTKSTLCIPHPPIPG